MKTVFIKGIILIVIGLILLTGSYLSTFWYDSVKESEIRQAYIVVFLISSGFGGFMCAFMGIIHFVDPETFKKG